MRDLSTRSTYMMWLWHACTRTGKERCETFVIVIIVARVPCCVLRVCIDEAHAVHVQPVRTYSLQKRGDYKFYSPRIIKCTHFNNRRRPAQAHRRNAESYFCCFSTRHRANLPNNRHVLCSPIVRESPPPHAGQSGKRSEKLAIEPAGWNQAGD